MKIAIIGSRKLNITNLESYLPDNVTEIVSGGASGIDACAKEYARVNGIKLKELFLIMRSTEEVLPLSVILRLSISQIK